MVTDRKKKKQKRDKLDVESLTDMLVYEMNDKKKSLQAKWWVRYWQEIQTKNINI